ncbi:hypothetical protein L0F63_005918, partial [Massospora cicadina]
PNPPCPSTLTSTRPPYQFRTLRIPALQFIFSSRRIWSCVYDAIASKYDGLTSADELVMMHLLHGG